MAEKKTKKICPLFFACNADKLTCVEEDCAWWSQRRYWDSAKKGFVEEPCCAVKRLSLIEHDGVAQISGEVGTVDVSPQ